MKSYVRLNGSGHCGVGKRGNRAIFLMEVMFLSEVERSVIAHTPVGDTGHVWGSSRPVSEHKSLYTERMPIE